LRRRYKRRSARGRSIGCTRAFGPARSPRALFRHQKKGALAPANGALFSGVFPVLATRALFGERQMCPRSAHCQLIGSAPPQPRRRGHFFCDSGAADQSQCSAPPGARPVCDMGKKVPNVGTAVTFEKACFAKVPTGCGSGANVPALSLLAKSARKKCARVPTGVDTWCHWRQHAHRGHFCASEKNAQMYRRHRN